MVEKKTNRCVVFVINLRCDYIHHLDKMSFASSVILYEFEPKRHENL